MKPIVCAFLALLALTAPGRPPMPQVQSQSTPARKADPTPPAPAPAPAGPSITLPATVTVDQPGFVTVVATAVDADSVRWFAASKPALQPLPPNIPQPAVGTFVGFTFAPGTFRLGCVPAKAVGGKAVIGEPVYVTVTVGAPLPPVPPQPPLPPTPADPFLATLQAAYAQETGATRASDVQQLAALFDAAGKVTVNDPMLTTVAMFQAKFKAATGVLLATTALPKVRAAIGANLAAVLPTSSTATLDAATRALISQNYARIATDLEALK